MNRIQKFLITTLLLAGLSAPAGAEGLPSSSAIFGVLDLKTKTFTAYPSRGGMGTATPSSSSPNATTAPKVVRGTLVLKFSIKLSPAVPAGKIATSISTIVADASPPTTGATYQSEVDGFLYLTRSGTTAVGSISLPYVATINSSTYQVQVTVAPIQVENDGSGVGPGLDLAQTIPVPASGRTTTLTFAGDL